MKFLLTSFIILTPFLLNASFLGPLVPECDGPECDLCDLLQLGQNVIEFLIYISIALAAIAFAWAGFLYMTAGGDQGKIKNAHDIFRKVAIGLIIVLGAYLIANLIVNGLTDGNIDEMFNC